MAFFFSPKPRIAAAFLGRFDLVQQLLDAKADVKQNNRGGVPWVPNGLSAGGFVATGLGRFLVAFRLGVRFVWCGCVSLLFSKFLYCRLLFHFVFLGFSRGLLCLFGGFVRVTVIGFSLCCGWVNCWAICFWRLCLFFCRS